MVAAVLAGLICIVPAVASAQTQAWPQRPVKFVLPFGAGSATDVAARMMSEKLAMRWGKPVVIENKPGADGLLAINAFVQANDDHVLLYASSASFNAHPYMHEKLSYDLERDLLPIARVTDTILSASVPAALGPKTAGRVRRAREGQAEHAQRRRRRRRAGFHARLFPQGPGPGGDQGALPRHRAGGDRSRRPGRSSSCCRRPRSCARCRQPARCASWRSRAATRASIFPDVPTIYEAGFPALSVETTAGLYGPKGMARDLRERLSKDVIAVVSEPAITDKLIETGQAVRLGGPDELAQTLKEQAAQMETVAKALGLKSNK